MILPDLHWRDSDKKSIRGYTAVQEEIADEIEKIMDEEGVTHLFDIGDWTDKGYRQDIEKYSHTNRVTYWKEKVKGNLAMVLGNHFFLERDTNPELYWIQPHDRYLPTKKVFAREPLVKLPQEVHIGAAQFSFFHYDRVTKNYFNKRQDGVKLHVGLYHDDDVLPNSVRLGEGIQKSITNEYSALVFNNIDHAIFGHIHTPYDTFEMVVNNRRITADVMGSGMITKRNENHKSVRLPVFKIDGESITLSYRVLDLKRNKLRFATENETVLGDSIFVPKDLQGTDKIDQLMIRTTASYISCETFMTMDGATLGDIEIFKLAASGELDIKKVVQTYREE